MFMIFRCQRNVNYPNLFLSTFFSILSLDDRKSRYDRLCRCYESREEKQVKRLIQLPVDELWPKVDPWSTKRPETSIRAQRRSTRDIKQESEYYSDDNRCEVDSLPSTSDGDEHSSPQPNLTQKFYL